MKNIIILGGGTAGWLTALYLKKFTTHNITVIENPNIIPIIAGESSGANFSRILKVLNLFDKDFILNTNCTPKLGSIFYDWKSVGENFVHGLIDGYYDQDYLNEYAGLTSHYDFLKSCIANNLKNEDIFFNCNLIKNNKIPVTDNGEINTVMWHICSRSTANYFKKIGLQRNINLIEGEYSHCKRNNKGDIESLTLKDNKEIVGDFFFDCSGFARLLLFKELKCTYKNYENLFTANKVLAWWESDVKKINHTKIYAMKYGWSWNINLQNRSGNGYLYDDTLINYDQALEEAEKKFNTKITPVANLKFTPMLSKEIWKNNVIAIGISGGFLEPLEANGLAQITYALELVERYWNLNENNDFQKEKFNKDMNNANEEIIDFLLMHYKSGRNDTAFWKKHQEDKTTYTKSLDEKLVRWKNGIFYENEKDCLIFNLESWAQVAIGLNLVNKSKLKENLMQKNINIIDNFNIYQKNLNSIITDTSDKCKSTDEWFKYINSINSKEGK